MLLDYIKFADRCINYTEISHIEIDTDFGELRLYTMNVDKFTEEYEDLTALSNRVTEVAKLFKEKGLRPPFGLGQTYRPRMEPYEL